MSLAFVLSTLLRRELLVVFLTEKGQEGWRNVLVDFFYKGYTFQVLSGHLPLELNPELLIFMVGLWIVLLKAKGAYETQVLNSLERQWSSVLKATVYATLALVALGFVFIYRQAVLPRTQIVLFPPIALCLLLVARTAFSRGVRWLHEKGWDRKAVLVVGTGAIAKDFRRDVSAHPEWGLDILGFVQTKSEIPEGVFPLLGTADHLCDLLHRYPVDAVVYAVSMTDLELLSEAIQLCELEGVETHIVSDFFRRLIARIHMDDIHGLHVLTLSTTPHKEWQLLVKRIADVVASGTALVLLSPLLALIALLVKLTSPGPIFYRWNVLGLNKKPFTGYKFRTMVVDADRLKSQLEHMNEMQGPVFKIRKDPRITWIGRFLRKFSLDELPQLYSVLKGDMSLVGPRPGGVTEVPKYENWHRRKLSVKPGITCLWQVRGRNQVTSFNDWVRMDLEYIDNWSLWLDFKILVKTIPVVLIGRGAS